MKIVPVNKMKVFNLLAITVVAAFLIGVSAVGARAVQGDDLFALGNQAYAEGKYDKAISFYQKVIQETGYTASVLYNMANAYYQKRDVGRAILNYERALYLDPGNADIRANLTLARRDFGLISEPAPGWQRFFDLFNLNGWALVTSGAFGIFSLLFLLRGIRPRTFRGTLFGTVTAVCLIFLVTGGAGIALQYGNLGRGIITKEHARLLVSPFDSAASCASLKDGKVVRMAKTYKGYVLVKGENGRSGWIKRDAVEPVVPSGSFG
jgi:tetratricopeptide (TPR) repeat protein